MFYIILMQRYFGPVLGAFNGVLFSTLPDGNGAREYYLVKIAYSRLDYVAHGVLTLHVERKLVS